MEIDRKSAEVAALAHDGLDLKLQEFGQVLQYQQENPLIGDERVAACAKAIEYAIDVNPQFQEELTYIFRFRPDDDVQNVFSVMVRAIQKGLISPEAENEFDYPEKFDMPNWMNWYRGIEWILDHPDLSERFSYDMWTRNLTSNITERYKNLKLLAILLPNTIPPNPRVADVGCSGNRGLVKLLLNRPFAPTRVMREISSPGNERRPDEKAHVVDERGTDILNKALASNVGFGPSVGIDKDKPFDPWAEAWADACSFLPSERLNQNLRVEYDFLGKQKVPGLSFVQADFKDVRGDAYKAQGLGRHMFDIIFYSTVVHQENDEEARKIMLDNGNELKRPQGERVVVDNFTKDPAAPSGLRFNPDYAEEWEYTTHIDDPSGSGELLEVFRWRTGRCLDLKAGRDLGRLATLPDINATLYEAIAGRD